MPKINAPTVKEHREAVQTALVDAAEQILREEGVEALTAGRVTALAGIARSSIYRYVESVDDLGGMVLERYLPTWQARVEELVDETTSDREAILVWARTHLHEAHRAGHGWLVVVARASSLSTLTADALRDVHERADRFLHERLHAMGVPDANIRARMIYGLMSSGFRCLDTDEPLDHVIERLVGAIAEIVDQP